MDDEQTNTDRSGSIGLTNAILLCGAAVVAFLTAGAIIDCRIVAAVGYGLVLVFLLTAYNLKKLVYL